MKKTIDEEILMEKPKKPLTRAESAELAKDEIGAMEEVIEATGQESEEGAVKWVIEETDKEQKESDVISDKQAEYFEDMSAKGQIKTYTFSLAKLLYNILNHHVEWPDRSKYSFYVNYAEDKIGVKLYTPKGQFARGFVPTHVRKYDLNAINVLVMQVENTIEDCEPKPTTEVIDAPRIIS